MKKAVSGLMGVPEGLTSEESSLISTRRTIWTPHQSSPTHPQVTSIAELHHPVEELAGCCRYFSHNLVLIVLEKSLYLVLTEVTQASCGGQSLNVQLFYPSPWRMGTLYSLSRLLPRPRTQQTQTRAHSQTCTWNSGTGPQPGLPGELAGASGGYSLLVLMSHMTSAWASPTYQLVYERSSSVPPCIAEHYPRVSL